MPDIRILILVAFLICALLVILVLVLKLCWRKASGGHKGKKLDRSLWVEEHSLTTKPGADD